MAHGPRSNIETHMSAPLWPEIALVCFFGPRHSEINKLHAAVCGQKEVVRLDVAVSDTPVVDVCKCGECLVDEGFGDD